MPKISVVMPVYNAEKYVEATIQNILKQSFSDFELIVIDDCGGDKSIEIVKKINDQRIKIISNSENKGIAYSRNIGIQSASGQYIALMDDDDLCPLDRFQKQSDFLDENSRYDVVGGRYEIIDENNKKIRTMRIPLNNPDYIKAFIMFYNPMANGSAMMRNEFIQKNKIRYQNNCMGMEDYRFWVDCSLKGNITNIEDIMLSWRSTFSNETNQKINNETDKRAKKYAEIQRYALLQNGFMLADEDIIFLNRMFPEDIKTNNSTAEDLQHLHSILTFMIEQAQKMKLLNEQEVIICCKKMFSLRAENSDIWYVKS